jgi:hypothetical protein
MPMLLSDTIKTLIRNAWDDGYPCLLATHGREGPNITPKGSMIVFDDAHLVWWERSKRAVRLRYSAHNLQPLRGGARESQRCLQGWRHTFTDCSGIRNFPVGREKGIGERWVESLSDDKNNGTRPRRRSMSDDVLLDQAAQLIADARVACLKLVIPPANIAKIMMDEAILALMAERLSLSDIQATFKKYAKRDLPRFYMDLRRLASDQAEQKSPN